MSDYNGWTNRETWLVNLWYMDDMPEYFDEINQYYVEPNELEEALTNMCEESELMSKIPCGLVADFLSDCWASVNWYELATYLNITLSEMEKENA